MNNINKPKAYRCFAWLSSFLMLSACVPYKAVVNHYQLHDNLIQSTPYTHRTFTNLAASNSSQKRWHIYVEGDGRAVNATGRPSADPTPRDPILLPMMARDPNPALYLGRPCYFYTQDPLCSAEIWTLQRYSKAVVASMVNALRHNVPEGAKLTLIGHSGGATLITLMAAELPNTERIITLAGNLQVKQWLEYHHYSPHPLCLDPYHQPTLAGHIEQFHFAGGHDKEILSSWIEGYSQRQPNSHFQILKSTDHQQNWPDWWTLINNGSTIK